MRAAAAVVIVVGLVETDPVSSLVASGSCVSVLTGAGGGPTTTVGDG